MRVLIFILSTMFSVHAAVIKNDVTGLKRNSYSLKEACEKAGFKHLLLVEAPNSTTIDCMGRTLKAQDFCEMHALEKNLLRGFVSQSKSQVYCEYGQTVSLSLSCDEEHYKYCQSSEQGCVELKDTFAKMLHLHHHSLTGTPKKLNCHFSIPDPLLENALQN